MQKPTYIAQFAKFDGSPWEDLFGEWIYTTQGATPVAPVIQTDDPQELEAWKQQVLTYMAQQKPSEAATKGYRHVRFLRLEEYCIHRIITTSEDPAQTLDATEYESPAQYERITTFNIRHE